MASARQKAEDLLRPHLQALLSDPRRGLPVPAEDPQAARSRETERCAANQ